MKNPPIRILRAHPGAGSVPPIDPVVSHLEGRTATVDTVSALAEAAAAFEGEQYHLCLVASGLDDRTAPDTARELAAHARRVPVVLLADPADAEVEADAPFEVLVRGEDSEALLACCLHYLAQTYRLSEELRLRREGQGLIASVSRDGFWDWDTQTEQIEYSLRWKTILGYGDDEIADQPDEWLSRIHPEDADHVRSQIEAHREGSTPLFQCEHRLLDKSGNYRWVLCRGLALRNGDKEAIRFAGTLTDVTESKLAEEQLRQGAFFDPLTGLPNRSVFADRLGRSVERAKRRGDYLFAVLFLDLDRFKVVNDSLGHAAGDELLVEVSERLKTCSRTTDTVARMGGDEFAILLEDIRDDSDALRVAERIQQSLREPVKLAQEEVFTSASVGICLSTKGYAESEDVLRDADNAMYRAKAKGKATHEIFDQDMHDRAVKRLKLEADLRRSIEREELVVHYQPIISLQTSRLASFEALVRWQRPGVGLVSPGDFIPIAEETGLIVDIDRWVLRQACIQLRGWQTKFPDMQHLSVSVNLSPKQLTRDDVVEYIERTLAETGLNPRNLRPEITESAIMENVDTATEILNRLRGLNILLHMDDFGTGYSSLGYLIRFHVDTLKIDGSFVSNMDVRGENFEIVRMIVALAHNLGMKVIAEGVETAEQLAQLRTLQCEFAQGYFFSRPVPADAAEAIIDADPKW